MWFLFFAPLALAASQPCPILESFSSRILSCKESSLVIQATRECKALIQAEVVKATKGLGGSLLGLQKKADATGLGQEGKFGSSTKDYETTWANLDRLARLQNAAIRETYQYLNGLALPEEIEDLSDPQEEKWAMEVPCYGSARDEVENALDLFEDQLKTTVGALKALDSLIAKTKGSGADLSSTTNPVVPNSSGKSASDKPAPSTKGKKYRQSDVSGTKEKR